MVRKSSSSAASMEGGDIVMKPAWLEGLLSETFFETCGLHDTSRKNEKNIFCLDCCHSFCPHCLPLHNSHPLLQVCKNSAVFLCVSHDKDGEF